MYGPLHVYLNHFDFAFLGLLAIFSEDKKFDNIYNNIIYITFHVVTLLKVVKI